MLFVLWITNFNSYWACDYLSMLELTLIHVSKKGLDCIKIGKVWSIRVICIRRFGNLSSRLHVSNSGRRTLFDWKCGVSVFHSCNIRIVWGFWSQSNFHDMIISIINIFWLHWIINRLVVIRGVTIHRCIGESYRNCQRYANRIVSGWIDSHDISSGGRNQAIKCP